MKHVFRFIWNGILKWLYPATCVFCGKVSEKEICEECRDKVFYIDEPRCKKCGKPVRYEEQEYCYDCRGRKFYYEQGRSVWLHKGNVPWSIYQFKYHNKRIYGLFYAKELYRRYGKWIRDRQINLIVPVPLHNKRRRQRGYNQAEVIAKSLGEFTGIPVDSKAVIRHRYTEAQKTLDHRERKKNVQDAFILKKADLNSKNVLIIDDIYTTGSTINSVAKVFVEKSNNKVWFLTISVGQDF